MKFEKENGIIGKWKSGFARKMFAWGCAVVFTVSSAPTLYGGSDILDTLDLGLTESEKDHNLTEAGSQVMNPEVDPDERWRYKAGPDSALMQDEQIAMGEAGRRLKPEVEMTKDVDTGNIYGDFDINHPHLRTNAGGHIAFDMDVDPDRQNYMTVKIWGSEQAIGGMAPMADLEDGEGYRFINPITGWSDSRKGKLFIGANRLTSIWRRGWSRSAAIFPGRWIYRTVPLPYEEVTKGKKQVRLRIQQVGFPGRNAEYTPTVYTVYTHTGSHFTPPADEPQGEPFEWGAGRPKPEGFSIEEALKDYALERIEHVMTNERRGNLKSLAEIYQTEWSGYYRDKRIIDWAKQTLDEKAQKYAKDDSLGMRWAGAGRGLAFPYSRLHEGFETAGILDEMIKLEDGGEAVPRREAYARMFKGEFDAFRHSRRSYTNQTSYGNRGLYFLNRALQQLKPEVAVPETEARMFLYELFGMMPFGADQSEYHKKRMETGFPWRVMTDKGLTREKGYTGNYGGRPEMITFLEYVDDPLLLQRAEEMVHARVNHFRWPSNTPQGYPTLHRNDTFSWRVRQAHPSPEVYGLWEVNMGWGHPFAAAAMFQDPLSVRLADLYIQHGHLYEPESYEGGVYKAIKRVKNYRVYKELPSSDYRIPWEPDYDGSYAWADEMNGIVMIRHGNDLIWANLWFLGLKNAINTRARIRHITPQIDRVVDFPLDRAHAPAREYTSGSLVEGIVRDDFVMPALPEGISRSSGRSAKAWFYQQNYGDYLIGMNTTSKSNYQASMYELDIPKEHQGKTATDLITGCTVNLSEPVILGPRSTMVLYVGDE